MIDLGKSKSSEPTPEEVRRYVNSIYEYAADLYINQDMSWGEVRSALLDRGLSVEDAETVVENLEAQESEARNSAANKELGFGVLWAAGGIIATVVSSGTVIFWGAVVWGGWLILKGLYHKID